MIRLIGFPFGRRTLFRVRLKYLCHLCPHLSSYFSCEQVQITFCELNVLSKEQIPICCLETLCTTGRRFRCGLMETIACHIVFQIENTSVRTACFPNFPYLCTYFIWQSTSVINLPLLQRRAHRTSILPSYKCKNSDEKSIAKLSLWPFAPLKGTNVERKGSPHESEVRLQKERAEYSVLMHRKNIPHPLRRPLQVAVAAKHIK